MKRKAFVASEEVTYQVYKTEYEATLREPLNTSLTKHSYQFKKPSEPLPE